MFTEDELRQLKGEKRVETHTRGKGRPRITKFDDATITRAAEQLLRWGWSLEGEGYAALGCAAGLSRHRVEEIHKASRGLVGAVTRTSTAGRLLRQMGSNVFERARLRRFAPKKPLDVICRSLLANKGQWVSVPAGDPPPPAVGWPTLAVCQEATVQPGEFVNRAIGWGKGRAPQK